MDIPEDVVAEFKRTARKLGGDAVLLFRVIGGLGVGEGKAIYYKNIGIEAKVVRSINADCRPIIAFFEGADHRGEKSSCPYEVLGNVDSICKGSGRESLGWQERAIEVLAESARSVSGTGIMVTMSEDTISGRATRFLDPQCRK
jgi:hypothetical protein